MTKKVTLFLLLICAAYAAQSQGRTQLTGKITDAKTGGALIGASITLSESKVGTVSDTAGMYRLDNIPFGHTIIEVFYGGYKTIIEHLEVKAGSNIKDFALISSIIENEAVTVTAVGSATSIRKAPIAILKVNREELLSTPSTNIIDAISRQPGVSQLTTGPAISKPIIRGLGYNRLVVINDGVRQEGQQWGDEHGIEIDENSVSRVEIVKGPASLIYGSDALAGVVNFITSVPVPVNTIKGNILSSYNSNNKQRSFYASIGGNKNGFNWNGWGDVAAAADYKNKYDGRVWNSKFINKNIGGYLGYNGGWGFSHLILSNFNQQLGVIEGERNSDGSFVKMLPGGLSGSPSESDLNSIHPTVPYQQIQHFKIISDNSFKVGAGRITLNLGWQRNQRQEFGNADDPAEKSLYFDLKTFNYNVAYHFDDRGGWVSSAGIGGMQQSNENKGAERLIPAYSLWDIGGFIYTQKTAGKATITGGLRFDNRSISSKEFLEGSDVKFAAFKKSFSNGSGSAGISYAATQNFVLKLNLAKGFRSPSIPELSSNGAHEGTNRYEYGNTNLVSETSWQGDMGIELNNEHVLFTASAFYNAINNFIYYRKLSAAAGGDSLVDAGGSLIPAYKFQQQDAHLAGAEFLLDIHPHPLDWLHWQNSFSYVKATFSKAVEGSKDVPLIPASRLLSEVKAVILPHSKTLKDLTLFVELDHTFAAKHPFTAYETETATDGYSLLNAGITTNINKGSKKLLSLYLLANNLGDVAYQNNLSRLKYTDVNPVTGRQGVFNMGRSFVVKVNIPLSFAWEKNK